MAEDTTLRDTLALERTRLANERTLLAYARTALALVVTGLGIVKLFAAAALAGWMMAGGGVIIAVFGIARFRIVQRKLK